MNLLIAGALIGGFLVATLLILPAIRRTDLRIWHPAIAWLALTGVFYGVGSLVLAFQERAGPAAYVAASVVAFAVGVAVSDRIARRRAPVESMTGIASSDAAPAPDTDPAPIRPLVALALGGLAIALIGTTVIRTGLPFLVGDITGARTELTGLPVQVLRVAIPGLALAIALGAIGGGRHRLAGWLLIVALVGFELILASRYLVAELVAILIVGIGLAGWTIRGRVVVAIVLASTLAFAGVGVLRAYDQAQGRELAFAVERTVNRVVLIQPRTLEALQEAIPADQPYFGGLTWVRRLGPAIGRPDIPNLGYWVYPRLFPDQTTPGYAAPGIIGEAWANFGPAGIALLSLLGVLAERAGALIAVRRPGMGDLVAGAMTVVFVARTHALGVNGLAILLVFVAAWRISAARGVREALTDARRAVTWRI